MTVTEDRTDLNGSRNTSHFENESWIEKPWKKFEIVVFRLQQRIYKAKSKHKRLAQNTLSDTSVSAIKLMVERESCAKPYLTGYSPG
jgi:hypothetical protein